MVDAVVSFVVGKLGQFLLDQAAFVHGARGQLEWVERELSWMQGFLKDADAKQERDERVKIWVAEVRDVACEAEDAIDSFISYTGRRQRQQQRWRRIKLLGFVENLVFFPLDMLVRRRFGNEIELIKRKLRDISQRRLAFGIRDIDDVGVSLGSESQQEWRKTSPILEDTEEVTGIQEEIQALVAQLTGGELCRFVVSIVGMAGLGKTTLARKVYNNDSVKNHFDCSAWICVSQHYTIKDLSQRILKQFGILAAAEEHEMNAIQMKERLFEHLKQRRYFIVLDDIWEEKAWDGLEAAFPNANNGSRILLTTRRNDVALHAQSLSHELRFLGEDESWQLFCRKTFQEQNNKCPLNLEKVGREIVARCGGLPLAIVVVGGLLSRKTRLPIEWEKFLRHISWQFVDGNAHISEILVLSYKDLPNHLKPCFLYLGIFAEDHEFYARKLVQLWIAEGFIEPRGFQTLEEVAEAYLDELTDRSLVQVARRSCNSGVRSCRVHDLVRDLSISKAKENKFLEIQHNNPHSLLQSKARRLAFHHGIHGYNSFNTSTPYLRSLICSGLADERLGKNQEKLLFSSFKLLRVLDIYGVPLSKLPNEIGALIHLRYLGCRRSHLKCLPSSIGSLCNLQTLDITSDNLVQIPNIIWEMQHVRHIRIKGRITKCSHWHEVKGNQLLEHGYLNNIQTLTHLEVGNWIEDYLGKLTNLRKLGIWGEDLYKHGRGLFDAIPKLKQLQYLQLGEWDTCSIPTLPPLSLHNNLFKLFLHGKLEKLPNPHEFPPNLTKLTLRMTRLEDDPMPTLEKIKNLRILKLLDNAYVGKEMVCSLEGFPQLEALHVVYLSKLEEWKVVEGAMPSLLHLRVEYCMQLKRFPQGLKHLVTAGKFEEKGMHPQLRERIQEV
ncbi:hypothetical protein ACLOJK_035487 [Asimina triloba]